MRIAHGSTPSPLLLMGTVRGLDAEGPATQVALDEFRPDEVAVGLSPEEVKALQEHFTDPRSEPWVPLSSSEVAYAEGLCLFGPVRVPSPAFVAAIRWAAAAGLPVEGVEPGDDHYSELFLEHVGYFDLLRRTLAERKLVRAPPDAPDAESFAVDWEERSQAGKGSHDLGRARSKHVAERLRELHSASGGTLKRRVALLVDVERFPSVLRRLQAGDWKDLRADPPPSRSTSPLPRDEASPLP